MKHDENFKPTFHSHGKLSGNISISAVIDMLAEPFDSDQVAQNTYNKNFDNPDSKYYQMTKEQILESWASKGAESRNYGMLLDEYIGIKLEGTDIQLKIFKIDHIDGDKRMEGLCASFDSFYKRYIESGRLVYVTREQYVNLELSDVIVRGRFDALFYAPATGHYVVVDWKSNGDIPLTPNQWTKKLLGPAKNLYDLAGNKYTTQVYFYKMALGNGQFLDGIEGPQDIDVIIVNLSGYDGDDNPIVNCIGPQYEYDEKFLTSIFTYAYKKKQLLSNRS